MDQLSLHPHCAPGPVVAVEAHIELSPRGCRAVFLARGDIGSIELPQVVRAERGHDLWKTTCFELFWSLGQTAYREFNLSPSSQWACYDFDDYRKGMRDAPTQVRIKVAVSATKLRLEAEIGSELPLPAAVALTAIIRDKDGAEGFWALAFPPGAPNFHATACRTLQLGAST